MQIHLTYLTAIAVVVTTIAGASAQATTLTFQPDRDNTIYEPGGLSNGAGSRIFAGRDGTNGNRKRGLLHFDLTGIPRGAAITSVTLDLWMDRTTAPSVQVSLHRALASWGVGTSNASGGEGEGAPSQGPDANWHERFHAQAILWSTPGGDYESTPSSATTVGGVGLDRWPSTPALVADVESWVTSPSTNFGWMLIGEEGTTRTSKAFGSAQHPTDPPMLRVTFDASLAHSIAFGAGCHPTTSPPTFAVDPSIGSGAPVIGGTFRLQVTETGAAPTCSAVLLGLSSLDPAAMLPPPLSCSLHVGSIEWAGPLDGSGGLTLSIPVGPGLLGNNLYWQALGAAGAAIATSGGVVTRIGT